MSLILYLNIYSPIYIATSAYEDLAKILTHPEYRKEDVTTNICQIRKWRNRLPLVRVRKHDVPLCSKQTPSTCTSTKNAFTISPLTYLERILNNPALMTKMYFGPGIVADEKQEFWHGELWQDSLLFGEDKIRNKSGGLYFFRVYIKRLIKIIIEHSFFNSELFRAGEFLEYCEQSSIFMCRVRSVVMDEIDNTLKLKTDALISHENLCNCRSTDNRHTRGKGKELWLVEEKAKLVNPESIKRHIIVWIRDMPKPAEVYDFYVDEIMYRFNGRWQYRNIAERHRLPCEYITLKQPQQNLHFLKIFLDIYVDDFGTYRNTYHSLGGVYLQFGNMPFALRKQLKNHFLLGFVPFGARFDDFIKPVLEDIKSLENGLIMKTLNGFAWVIGGLGCVTADLPQGNDLADVKRHGANYGCRTCNISNDQYTNPGYDFMKNARFHHQMNEQFIEIRNQHSKVNKERLATKYGLVEPVGPFNILQWDRHIQIPQDAYHSMAGKAGILLDATFNVLNSSGEDTFEKHWRSIETPAHWSRMPNPL